MIQRANPDPQESVDDGTRNKLKHHARRLFGERGIDNVAVRDILSAAGQRNVGAIGYYFGSKDALAREILEEGALLIDAIRNALLDQVELEKGSSLTVRDVLWVIVRSSLDLASDREGQTYIRFFATFHKHNHPLFVEITGNGLDRGFRRCIAHLRRLLPDHPRTIFNERVFFMMLMMGAALSIREIALEHDDPEDLPDYFGGGNWKSEGLLENLIDACEGIYRQPVAPETVAYLQRKSANTAKNAPRAGKRTTKKES